MAYIRDKTIKGISYSYLEKSEYKNGVKRTVHLAYLGRTDKLGGRVKIEGRVNKLGGSRRVEEGVGRLGRPVERRTVVSRIKGFFKRLRNKGG